MSSRYRTLFLVFMVCIGTVLLTASADAQSVFINELHYDNNGADADEGVEIAGPAGTDLTGWRVRLYNGADGAAYAVIVLSGTLPNQCDGYGAIWFAEVGLQNGAPDGLALVDDGGAVIQFLSYEGTFTATDLEAAGMLSTDIGVSEASTAPVGTSLQLGGGGTNYEDFTWATSAASSHGACNPNQTFEEPVPTKQSTWGAVKSIYR